MYILNDIIMEADDIIKIQAEKIAALQKEVDSLRATLAIENGLAKKGLMIGSVYRLWNGDLAVFSRWTYAGDPIFHELGEPDMQSSFILRDWVTQVKEFVRNATDDDLGR